MSDETSPSPDTTEAPAETAPRVRRISNPRPKKRPAAPAPAEPAEPAEPAAEAPAESRVSADWPEPEAASEAGGDSDAKRKRRRRKGKGGKNKDQGANGQMTEETVSLAEPAAPASSAVAVQPAPASRPLPQPPHNNGPARNSSDPKEMATKAWKIFLAEVSEEGVSLISDHDARELSRRCFKLAEIFLDEKGRRLR